MKKRRFADCFYRALVNYAEFKDHDVKTVCLAINHKRKELSELVSVEGALLVLYNEAGFKIPFIGKAS